MRRVTAAVARRWGTTLVAAVCIACVATGIFGWWQAGELRSTPAAENSALVDQSATDTVASEVSRALTQVLTYDHQKPEATQRAADTFLAGAAQEEYDTLFASLRERAPNQKLVLSASVQAVGVKHLTEDTAELLVFLDQRSQRASDEEATVSASQLAVTAEQVDGTWKVTELTPL